MPEALLTVSEAARWAKVSESYLNKARVFGNGPRYIRLGRAVRYRQEDLETWAQQTAAASTSEYDHTTRFPDAAVRSAIVGARNETFATSYLDPAAWDAKARTIKPRTETGRRKLCQPEIQAVLNELGVTVNDHIAAGL